MQQISLSLLSLHRSKQGNVSHFISAVQTPECSTTDAHTDTHTLTVTAFFRSTAQFKNLRLVLFFLITIRMCGLFFLRAFILVLATLALMVSAEGSVG